MFPWLLSPQPWILDLLSRGFRAAFGYCSVFLIVQASVRFPNLTISLVCDEVCKGSCSCGGSSLWMI